MASPRVRADEVGRADRRVRQGCLEPCDVGAVGKSDAVGDGVEREVVMMRAVTVRRTWSVVADVAEVVAALARAGRHFTAEDPVFVWTDVPEQPMGEDAARRIGVEACQRQADGGVRDVGPLQLGRGVLTVTCRVLPTVMATAGRPSPSRRTGGRRSSTP